MNVAVAATAGKYALAKTGLESATQGRGIISTSMNNKTAKQMQSSSQNFAREMRDWTSSQYDKYGVPFIPGMSSTLASPFPKYTQAIGNRSVTTPIPGMNPLGQTGNPNFGFGQII